MRGQRSRVGAARALLSLALSLVLSGFGCSRTADEEQCKKLVEKSVELLAVEGGEHGAKVKKRLESDARVDSISKETCIGKISRSQYECMIAAKTFEAFAACDAK